MKRCSNPHHMEGNKKIRRVENEEDDDVYARLGEPIWSSILSLLPLHEAVRTSVLSRSWRHAWKSIPDLDLGIFDTTLWRLNDEERSEWFPEEDAVNDWVETVDHILDSHIDPIQSCRIPIYYCYDSSDVDRWIEVLMQRSVQRLEIESCQDFMYKTPESLFGCKTLKELKLQCCDMRLSADIRFGCKDLRSLELYETAVDAQTLQRFLSQSKLDGLTLSDCDVLAGSLHIDAPNNLKCLDISFSRDGARCARINAPHLKSLDLKHWAHMLNVEICAPELERVCCNATGVDGDKMRKLLSGTSHATVLELSGSTKCLQGIEDFPCLLNVKKLRIQVDLSATTAVALLSKVLSKCPNLEELDIRNGCDYLDGVESKVVVFGWDYWKEQFVDFVGSNLKNVVINNQNKYDHNFRHFLQFLLRSGTNLSMSCNCK